MESPPATKSQRLFYSSWYLKTRLHGSVFRSARAWSPVLPPAPLDLALRQAFLQLGDAGGTGPGAAQVEPFQVRQAGQVFDPGVAQAAARQRQPFERR